jgi:hypothetical protein
MINFAKTLVLMRRYVHAQEELDLFSAESLMGPHMVALLEAVIAGELTEEDPMALQMIVWARRRDLLIAA